MIISSVTIENFKGIQEPVQIDLKPITLLFGANSAGKSSLLHALLYASEVFERRNLNAQKTILGGDEIQLGGFKTFLNRMASEPQVSLRFDLDLEKTDLPEYIYEDAANPLGMAGMFEQSFGFNPLAAIMTGWVKINIRWNDFKDEPYVSLYETGFNNDLIARVEASSDSRQIALTYLNIEHKIFKELNIETGKYYSDEDDPLGLYLNTLQEIYSAEGDNINIPVGIAGQDALPNFQLGYWAVEDLSDAITNKLEEFSIPSVALQVLEGLLNSLTAGAGDLLRDELRRLCYVGPLRVAPPRNFEPLNHPERSRWADGTAAWDTLYRWDDEQVKKASDWLSQEDRLNSGYSIHQKSFKELYVDSPLYIALTSGDFLDTEADELGELINLPEKKRVMLVEEKSQKELYPQDVGVGISQVLPIIVAALSEDVGGLISEQPELHIHPALQVSLGDLFIDRVVEHGKLFLLETHSEHLLLRLLRRLRETYQCKVPPGKTRLSPDQLSIYFVEPEVLDDEGRETGSILFRKLEVAEDGKASGEWPKGFFGERTKELR